MKTVPGEFKMKAIETADRGQMVAANSLAWKGTVLLVGMISLLVLLSGCYTVVATYTPGRLSQYYEDIEYEDPQQALIYDEPQIYEEPQSVGVQIPAVDFDSGMAGVGVRYRQDYGNDPYGYSPWVRRLYVDTYYNVHHRYRFRPNRMAFGWSVGMWWGGFSNNYGYYETCFYDPFYWDLWWNDPYSYYDASYRSYWYPWRWSYVHSGWYWPCRFDYYYGYDPFFHDPYWGSYWYHDNYWYGGRGTGAIVSRDYERRSTDRRRGLADARNARDGTGGSRDAATGDARDRTTRGDNPLIDSRRPSDRTTTFTDNGRTISRRDPGTRAGNGGSDVGQRKIRGVPPAKPEVAQGVKPLQGKPAQATGPASAKSRNERTDNGSSTSRTLFRTLGQLLGRATGTSSRSRNSGSSTRSGSRNRTTSSPPPRTTTTTRPRTSRPPPQTTASSNPTSTRTNSRTTVMPTRTTRSNPGASSSRPTTTSRTYTPPRSSTSSRTTSSRPTRTSSRPRTTTSRPPPRTSSPRRTTTSRPPPRSSSGSRTTSSRPPRTTSRPPPEGMTSATGLTGHSNA